MKIIKYCYIILLLISCKVNQIVTLPSSEINSIYLKKDIVWVKDVHLERNTEEQESPDTIVFLNQDKLSFVKFYDKDSVSYIIKKDTLKMIFTYCYNCINGVTMEKDTSFEQWEFTFKNGTLIKEIVGYKWGKEFNKKPWSKHRVWDRYYPILKQ